MYGNKKKHHQVGVYFSFFWGGWKKGCCTMLLHVIMILRLMLSFDSRCLYRKGFFEDAIPSSLVSVAS